MRRIASLLPLILFSCELPQPVSLEDINLVSRIDLACKIPLDERNVFDTLKVNKGYYGFCSAECKKAYINGATIIPCPLPGS